MSRPTTRIIVNADDFGLHPAINGAVLQGHEHGIITACSLIPIDGQPAYDEAIEIAARHPKLDVGLHFALVGLPGQPKDYREFLVGYYRKEYPDSRIIDMLNLQIELLERSGIKPTHIDSHQHLHALPEIMRIVCQVAAERGIRAVRLPVENPSPSHAPARRAIVSRVLGVVASRGTDYIGDHKLWRPDYFMGLAVSGNLTEARLLAILDRLPHGVTEIVCHPGVDNKRLGALYPWGYDWEKECKAILSEQVSYRIANLEIELTNFWLETERKKDQAQARR